MTCQGNDTHWLGTDSMERDPIASHKSYTNQLYPTGNPQSTPSHPPPQVRAAGRIVDTSWFAVPGGVCAISRSNRKAGQARVRQTDNTLDERKEEMEEKARTRRPGAGE